MLLGRFAWIGLSMPSTSENLRAVADGHVGTSALATITASPVERSHGATARGLAWARQASAAFYDAFIAGACADVALLRKLISLGQVTGEDSVLADAVGRYAHATVARGFRDEAIEAVALSARLDLARSGPAGVDRELLDRLGSLLLAQLDAFDVPESPLPPDDLVRIGYLTTVLDDNSPQGELLRAFASTLQSQRYRLTVYTTESTTRAPGELQIEPFVPQTSQQQARRLLKLLAPHAQVRLGPVGGPASAGVLRIARQIRADAVDVLLIDADLRDPVALLASWAAPVEARVALARSGPLAGDFDAIARLEAVPRVLTPASVRATDCLQGVARHDIDATAVRTALGIGLDALLLAADLPGHADDAWIDTIARLLESDPRLEVMLTGPRCAAARRRLTARGLLTRAHFPETTRDEPTLLACADVVLIPPGDGSTTALSAAMAGRALVAIESPGLHPHTASMLQGDLVPEHRGVAGVFLHASRLITQRSERLDLGARLSERARMLGSIERTARLLTRLAHQCIEGPVNAPMRSAFAA
jgi:hypothetical protein